MKKEEERKPKRAKRKTRASRKPPEQGSANHGRRFADELISKALYNEITPDEAERQAKAAGLPPLASWPDPSEHDPMKESRWTLLQVVAWIAWRDVSLAREQCPAYRKRCSYWVFRPWNEPIGDRFEAREGWFIQAQCPPSSFIMTLDDARMRCEGELPESARLTPKEAEIELLRALADDRLKAEAFDKNRNVVEIPAREWPRLGVFEERDEPVLKYKPLDAPPAYTGIQFKRSDVMSVWPRYVAVDLQAMDLGNMSEQHFGMMLSDEAYVPFSVAVCWIATRSGRKQVSIRDEAAWERSAKSLLAHIADTRIDIIGCGDDQETKRLDAACFDSSDCPHPYSKDTLRYACAERTHVLCEFYSGDDDWKSGRVDQFFLEGKRRPHWRRLRVRRSQMLELFPKPPPTANLELECVKCLKELMAKSKYRPKLKSQLLDDVRAKVHGLSKKQSERAWTRAINEGPPEWRRRGPVAKGV